VNIENFVMPEPEEVWQIIVDSAADLADALNDKLGQKRFTYGDVLVILYSKSLMAMPDSLGFVAEATKWDGVAL
jgi:hypothetical protein